MHRRLFALCALLCVPAAAFAAPPPLAVYAAALRAFDPHLPPSAAWRLAERVVDEADRARIDARLIVALVAVESGWHAEARSAAGARGLGQLMPATAAELGVDPDEPEANLHGTVRHLGALLARYARLPPGDRYRRALAAYNAGTGAVDRYGGVPPFPETRTYVARVIALWRRLVTG